MQSVKTQIQMKFYGELKKIKLNPSLNTHLIGLLPQIRLLLYIVDQDQTTPTAVV